MALTSGVRVLFKEHLGLSLERDFSGLLETYVNARVVPQHFAVQLAQRHCQVVKGHELESQ